MKQSKAPRRSASVILHRAVALAEILEPRRLLAADATISYTGVSFASPTTSGGNYTATVPANTTPFATWTIKNKTNAVLTFDTSNGSIGFPGQLAVNGVAVSGVNGLHISDTPTFNVPASGSTVVTLALQKTLSTDPGPEPGTYNGDFAFNDTTVTGGLPGDVLLTAVPDGTTPTKLSDWNTITTTTKEPTFSDSLSAYAVEDDTGNRVESQTFDAAFFTLPEDNNKIAASITSDLATSIFDETGIGVQVELLPDKHPGTNKLYADDFEQPITSVFVPVTSGTTATSLNQSLNHGSYVLYISADDAEAQGVAATVLFKMNTTITPTPPPQISVLDSDGPVGNSTSTQPSTGAGTSFGTIPFGSSASATLLTFTVKNSAATGAANLIFASNSDGPNIGGNANFQAVSSLVTGGTGLAPGKTETFSVELTSTSLKTAGSKSALIDVVSNAGTTDYQFLVGGTVAAPIQPAIALQGNGNAIANNSTASTSTGTNFGSVVQNSSPALTETYTVKNNGNAPLSITSGPSVAGPFSIVGTPLGSSIPAGGSGTFQVQLNDGTAGSATGTVSLGTNDPNNSTFNFALAATVTVPQVPALSILGNGILISNNAAASTSTGTNLGSVSQFHSPPPISTFTVDNNGNVPLTITSGPSVTGSFSIVGTPLASSIPAGGSGTFQVQLDDGTTGPANGTVTLVTNDPTNGTFNFALAGDVQSIATVPGILKIKAEDVNGAVAKGATVKIYASGASSPLLVAKTHSNGIYEDTSLAPGKYTVKLYSPAGNLWATDSAAVTTGAIKSLTVKENLPLEISLKAYVAKTGKLVTGTVTKGTPLLFKVTVKNDTTTTQSARVLLTLKYGTKLLTALSQTSSHKSIAPGGTAAFSFSYTPNVTGEFTADFIVETLLSGSYIHTNSGGISNILKLA